MPVPEEESDKSERQQSPSLNTGANVQNSLWAAADWGAAEVTIHD